MKSVVTTATTKSYSSITVTQPKKKSLTLEQKVEVRIAFYLDK